MPARAVLLGLFALGVQGSPIALNLKLFSAGNAAAGAVCNDGSPGGYYFAQGTAGSDSFLVHLPGGGQCWDLATCAARWGPSGSSLMSTQGAPATVSIGGIFDNDASTSPLASFHKASLVYCSSDGYMGNVAASPATGGYSFRGRVLVETMLRQLVAHHNLSSTSTVVFAGTSAGARGVMVLVDLLVSRQRFPAGARIAAFLDSPFWVDMPTPSWSSFPGFLFEERSKAALYNTTADGAEVSVACVAHYHLDGSAAVPVSRAEAAARCMMGQYRMPFVQTPYLLVASQFDTYQLGQYVGSGGGGGASVGEFQAALAIKTRALLVDLATSNAGVATANQHRAVFSWTRADHAVSCSSSDFSTASSSSGVTQAQALAAFLNSNPYLTVGAGFGPVTQTAAPAAFAWIDECSSCLPAGLFEPTPASYYTTFVIALVVSVLGVASVAGGVAAWLLKRRRFLEGGRWANSK